jgi:hypothetical protein
VFSLEFLSALHDVAREADHLVNLVLDGKSYADVMRELILDLNRADNESCGDWGQVAGDLSQRQITHVEMRDGDIWLDFKEEEEEACPAKP